MGNNMTNVELIGETDLYTNHMLDQLKKYVKDHIIFTGSRNHVVKLGELISNFKKYGECELADAPLLEQLLKILVSHQSGFHVEAHVRTDKEDTYFNLDIIDYYIKTTIKYGHQIFIDNHDTYIRTTNIITGIILT